MNYDLWMMIGAILVALLMGLEFGADFNLSAYNVRGGNVAEVNKALPGNLESLAMGLAGLHQIHAVAKVKRVAAEVAAADFAGAKKLHGDTLEVLLARIRSEYSL